MAKILSKLELNALLSEFVGKKGSDMYDDPEIDLDKDEVNHPSHYTAGKVECIDAIESALTPEEFRGYLKGNILKYTWRERSKGGDESMRKAEWYLARMVRK